MKNEKIRLGVNIDHVATLRQARGVHYPDPIQAALSAISAGADGITLHLREDRRHIQDQDLHALKKQCTVPINLEIAATEEMIAIAEKIQPEHCCLVPEKREELTTEGGLNVVAQEAQLIKACQRLSAAQITVSLFIDADPQQIDAAKRCGAPVIELHTGHYADAQTTKEKEHELQRIKDATEYANNLGLIVNAGHGLHAQNVQPIAAIPTINELNIGHSIIAQAIFDGMENTVRRMKTLMQEARTAEEGGGQVSIFNLRYRTQSFRRYYF